MSYGLPQLVKDSERLLKEIEEAVSRWARAHRYMHGATLRTQAMQVAQLAHRAWRIRERREALTDQLIEAVDDLKLSLQLGSQIKAFASFAQFEALARQVNSIGQQCGGWRRKQLAIKGQNAQQRDAGQRAEALSSCGAPNGAYP
jgi:hypothetical protein